MKKSLRRSLAAATTLAVGVLGLAVASLTTAPAAQAASLVTVSSFANNPGGLNMSLFVPDSLPAKPAVLVVVHYCGGSAQAMYNGTQFDELASRYGYIVVYPQVNRPRRLLRRRLQAGPDPRRLERPDEHRVDGPVTYSSGTRRTPAGCSSPGTSSGAMMTQVLLATYPDVFAAGRGVRGGPRNVLRDGSPTRRAPRPRHPGTATARGAAWSAPRSSVGRPGARRLPRLHRDAAAGAAAGTGRQDTTLSYVNFGEAIKQWTNVLGVSATPASTDYPASGPDPHPIRRDGRPRAGRGDQPGQGVGHNLPVERRRRRSTSSAWTRRRRRTRRRPHRRHRHPRPRHRPPRHPRPRHRPPRHRRHRRRARHPLSAARSATP